MNRLIKLFFVAIIFSFSTAYGQTFNGFALYNSLQSNIAYLIDDNGTIRHTWNCSYPCNYAVQLKDNGNLLRGGALSSTPLSGAAKGGIIQELDPSANVVWQFQYSSSSYLQHHDICEMPNGGVLLTAWETKTLSELQALGYTGNNAKWPTHFVEVQQNGTGGQIVWEWHIIDHLIQDVDSTKPNYGVVANNPQLMDINVPAGGFGPPGSGDWFHVNGVDYNDSLDQIVFSSRYVSEIFVIDHSTTTAEAASHSGGNSGMGGDFLYRWGNPSNYDTPGSQIIPGPVHDSRWIPYDGRKEAGHIMFFNNAGLGSNTSTVDAILPPYNGYNYSRTSGQAYGPTAPDFRHTCVNNASGQSAADRLSNGNTFVNLSGKYMYEVDSNDVIVWQYSAGPAKAFRYECDHPGIIAILGNNPCNLTTVAEIRAAQTKVFPNPSAGNVSIEGLDPEKENTTLEIYNYNGELLNQMQYQNQLDISNYTSGLYIIKILERNQAPISKMVLLEK